MSRPKRADEANCIYHSLNRGHARYSIFEKGDDFDAFERIVAEGLNRYPCRILAYQRMHNHLHFVLQPKEGCTSRRLAVGIVVPLAGPPRARSKNPVRLAHCTASALDKQVREPPREKGLKAVRRSIKRGSPYGNEGRVESTAQAWL